MDMVDSQDLKDEIVIEMVDDVSGEMDKTSANTASSTSLFG